MVIRRSTVENLKFTLMLLSEQSSESSIKFVLGPHTAISHATKKDSNFHQKSLIKNLLGAVE